MTLTSEVSAAHVRRLLAIAAGLALALALLPLAGTAQAQDPPPNAPCPEGTPEADFVDRETARAAHLLSIDCVAFHAISVGSSDAQGNPVYLPDGIVNRGQMATFIANTLEAAGFELPDGGGDDEFTDISGTVHRPRINALARAGIVSGRTPELYRPLLPVTRAQMATFIVQAAEWAFDEELQADDGPWFEDTIGTTHQANIDAGFEFGLFSGRVAPTETELGRFDPTSGTRRDQMATFLSRLLDFVWIDQGIFGAVIDADDEQPIAGADVTITDADGNVVVEFTTGESGLFVVELDVGTYDVTADADGYDAVTEEDVAVTEGAVAEVTLALTAAAQGISGEVTAQDGAPIAGATVTASDNGDVATATTSEDGSYELNLDVGTYTVTAEAEGYGTETRENVEVTAEAVTDLDITLTLVTGTATVTVNDADGAAFAGATVTVTDGDGAEVGTDTTDASGQATFTLVPGSYTVTASATDFDDASDTVEVTADTDTPVTLALSPTFVEPVTASLTADSDVAVVSETANPGNDFVSSGDINFELVVTDADGTVVPTGGRDYTFTITNDGGSEVIACVRCAAPDNVSVAPGATETITAPDRERVRIDAAAPTSVMVEATTTVAGEPVGPDTATAMWVDAAPTGGGAAASYSGTVTASNTDEDSYLIETTADGQIVFVEYTGGATDTYTVDGAPANEAEFETALEVGATIAYDTDADNNQTHDLTPAAP